MDWYDWMCFEGALKNCLWRDTGENVVLIYLPMRDRQSQMEQQSERETMYDELVDMFPSATGCIFKINRYKIGDTRIML